MIGGLISRYWIHLLLIVLLLVLGQVIYRSIERSILGGVHEKNQQTINSAEDADDAFVRCHNLGRVWDYRSGKCGSR